MLKNDFKITIEYDKEKATMKIGSEKELIFEGVETIDTAMIILKALIELTAT